MSEKVEYDTKSILNAVRYTAKQIGNKNLEKIIMCILQQLPYDINKSIEKDIKKMSPEERLAFVFNYGFTKSQYKAIRLESKERGADNYLLYSNVLESKKKADQIICTSLMANMPLHNLLIKPVQRIIESQEAQIISKITNKEKDSVELIFVLNWGFDGASNFRNSGVNSTF